MSEAKLSPLNPTEQQAVLEFVQLLMEQFDGLIRSLILFGSKARGDSTSDSDIDVLVVMDSDDWRVHKQVHYLAADILLKYDLDLSPRVWSVTHYQEMAAIQTRLYRNIQRDGINLLDLASPQT